MKLFLTTAVLAAALSTSAFAQGTKAADESKSAPSGQTSVSSDKNTAGSEGAKASGAAIPGGAMKPATTGVASDPKKDPNATQGQTGEKTGVTGGGNK